MSDTTKIDMKNKDRMRGSRMTKEQMTAVVWTTMLGLPIVQPYRKVKRKQVRVVAFYSCCSLTPGRR